MWECIIFYSVMCNLDVECTEPASKKIHISNIVYIKVASNWFYDLLLHKKTTWKYLNHKVWNSQPIFLFPIPS